MFPVMFNLLSLSFPISPLHLLPLPPLFRSHPGFHPFFWSRFCRLTPLLLVVPVLQLQIRFLLASILHRPLPPLLQVLFLTLILMVLHLPMPMHQYQPSLLPFPISLHRPRLLPRHHQHPRHRRHQHHHLCRRPKPIK